MSTHAWGPGHVIAGKYELGTLLGEGGMGSVFRARHLQLDSEVAVKLLDPATAESQDMLARFSREAKSAASLRSQHVVQIFDYGIEDHVPYIVMELLNGESLGDRLERLGKLSAEDTVRFISEVLRAMSKAHEQGIVHRDLKPDNIFIIKDDVEYAKVLDFGIAKVQESGSEELYSKTKSGVMLGTPYYMSPEQVQTKPVDGRTDLWAIAILTFQCITGHRPFNGNSFGELILSIASAPIPIPSELGPVPPGFDEWFVRAAQRDPNKRFQTAREMSEELASLLGSRRRKADSMPPVGALRPKGGPAEPAVRLNMTTGQSAASGYSPSSQSSGNSWWLVAAALVVVGGGVSAALMLRSGQASDASAAAAAPLDIPAPVELPPAEAAPPTTQPETSPGIGQEDVDKAVKAALEAERDRREAEEAKQAAAAEASAQAAQTKAPEAKAALVPTRKSGAAAAKKSAQPAKKKAKGGTTAPPKDFGDIF